MAPPSLQERRFLEARLRLPRDPGGHPRNVPRYRLAPPEGAPQGAPPVRGGVWTEPHHPPASTAGPMGPRPVHGRQVASEGREEPGAHPPRGRTRRPLAPPRPHLPGRLRAPLSGPPKPYRGRPTRPPRTTPAAEGSEPTQAGPPQGSGIEAATHFEPWVKSEPPGDGFYQGGGEGGGRREGGTRGREERHTAGGARNTSTRTKSGGSKMNERHANADPRPAGGASPARSTRWRGSSLSRGLQEARA